MKILLLDDDDRVRFNLKLFLQDENLDCEDFTNAEEAMEALHAQHFDVAIVDIRLPGKNGEEFILMAKEAAPHLQIIVHTGTANYKLPPEILALGVQQQVVLHKPVENMNIILDTLKRMFG